MQRNSGREDKVYKTNSWCVSGSKIQLQKPLRKCYTDKTLKLTLQDEEEVVEDRKQHATNVNKGNRKTISLHITDYKNLEVCNKQLKHIYETVEVEDFKRILENVYISDAARKVSNRNIVTGAKEDKILRKYEKEADEIYEEFFGQYYNYLCDVINNLE